MAAKYLHAQEGWIGLAECIALPGHMSTSPSHRSPQSECVVVVVVSAKCVTSTFTIYDDYDHKHQHRHRTYTHTQSLSHLNRGLVPVSPIKHHSWATDAVDEGEKATRKRTQDNVKTNKLAMQRHDGIGRHSHGHSQPRHICRVCVCVIFFGSQATEDD